MLVLFGAREAGCFREVAALYSDYYFHCMLAHAIVMGLGAVVIHKQQVWRS